MKFLILLIVVFTSCSNLKQNEVKEKLHPPQKVDSNIVHRNINPVNSISDTIIYFKNNYSLNLNLDNLKYVSDTITSDKIEYVVYGGIYDLNVQNSTFYTYIDSVKIIDEELSILKNEGLGGYLYQTDQIPFEQIIKTNDVDKDGLNDIEIFNSVESGNSNSTFDVFIKKNSRYELNSIFSLPNLHYDENTKTYTSRGNAGGAGRIYRSATYEYKNNELIPIFIETQDFDKTKNSYIRTKENLIDSTKTSEEITY